MFARLRRIVGMIGVVEKDGIISVEGIPADVISKAISKIWSTQKINLHMFTRLTKNGFSFHSFFAPDVVYALQTIAEQKRGWLNEKSVSSIIELLYEHTWLRNIRHGTVDILNFDRLDELNVTLLPHQLDFLRTYNTIVPQYGLHGYILSAAAGSGKTIGSLALGVCLETDLVVIVAPKHALERVWEDTIITRFKNRQTFWNVSSGRKYGGEKYVICHFEAIPKLAEALRGYHPSKPLVVLDESHNLNELAAQRTTNFIDLVKQLNAKHVVWSSGTPLKALGYEVIPILRTIDPLFTPHAEGRFRQIYGRNAARALDILKNRLGIISFKVAKSEIQLITKPTMSEIRVVVPNGGDFTLDSVRDEMQKFIEERTDYYREHSRKYEVIYRDALSLHEKTISDQPKRAQYATYVRSVETLRKGYEPELHKEEVLFANNYEKKIIIPSLPSKEMRDAFKDARSVIKYVGLKIMGEALGGVLSRKRVLCHLAMVDSLDLSEIIDSSVKKTVIFTSYVEVLKALQEKLEKQGYKTAVVFGETNSEVNSIVDRFFRDQEVNPLIATYQSLSTAVPLIAANTAVFINQPFRDYIKIQAQARIDRLGQDSSVFFHDVVLDTGTLPNISTRSKDILEWSKSQVALMMGDESSTSVLETVDKYYASTEGFVDQTLENFHNTLISLLD